MINNCYSTGKLEATSLNEKASYAGIAGLEHGGIIRNCYWDEETALLPYNGSDTNETNVQSMTLSDMCSQSFADTLNVKRGSQSTWSKWLYTGDTPVHAPVYEIQYGKVTNGSAKTNFSYANAGQTVTLTISPKSNTYKNIIVTVKSSTGSSINTIKKNNAGTKYKFEMPDNPVKVTVKCKKK